MTVGKSVLMVGPSRTSKGGIASVIDLYRQGGLFDLVCELSSYEDGTKFVKLQRYFICLIQYLKTLIVNPSLRIVHIHVASAGSFFRKSLLILGAKAFRKKVVLHVHGAGFYVFFQRMPKWGKTYIKTVLRCSDVIIALSSQWKQYLLEISNHPDIRIIYNPTILPSVEPSVAVTQAASVFRESAPVEFLFMGRLEQRKGIFDLISAIKQIQNVPVMVRLFGDGQVKQALDLIQQLEVQEQIQFMGWVDGEQKAAALKRAQVLLLPSYHEGLPVAILEALAYGLPVIASDVGGISEAVVDGQNGYLIQPGDCQRLAFYIEQLANSSELRAKMGDAGYQLAAKKFSLPIIVRQLTQLYAELQGI